MKRLRTKMFLFILVPTLVFFVGTIIYVSLTVNDIATRDAQDTLLIQGESVAADVRQEIEGAIKALDTLAKTFTGIFESGQTMDRETANAMVQQLLYTNSEAISAWMFWDDNAFDGKDAEFANTEGHDATGKFIPVWSWTESGDFVLEPVSGYDEPGIVQENIESVLNTGNIALFEPYEYTVDGQTNLITSIAVPIKINDQTVGMTGFDISLENIDQVISELSFYGTGFAGLMANNGYVISHNNLDLIGTPYQETGAVKNHPEIGNVVEAIEQGFTYSIEGFSNALETDVYRLFTPIHFEGVEKPWSAFLAAPKDQVLKEANSLMVTIISIGLVIAILLTVILLFVTRSIVNPIQAIAHYMDFISKGDISQEELIVKAKDETGRLAQALNAMQAGLRELVGDITGAVDTVTIRSEELNQAANEVGEGTEQMAATMEQLAGGAENQANDSANLATLIGDFVNEIKNSSSDVTGIQDASQQVVNLTNHGKELMNTSTDQMEAIDRIVHDAVEKVEGLDRHSQQISELVTVIQDIAEQTNLLALNAAIEAARAGEHGQGFAVVADEVRKLAEQSASSVTNITDISNQIQAEASIVANSLRDGYKEVEQGTVHIRTTDETFKEISESVTTMGDNINRVTNKLQDIITNSTEMSSSIENIAAISEQSAAGVEEATAATEQVNATMQEVSASSEELSQLADELERLIEQFKV